MIPPPIAINRAPLKSQDPHRNRSLLLAFSPHNSTKISSSRCSTRWKSRWKNNRSNRTVNEIGWLSIERTSSRNKRGWDFSTNSSWPKSKPFKIIQFNQRATLRTVGLLTSALSMNWSKSESERPDYWVILLRPPRPMSLFSPRRSRSVSSRKSSPL